MLTKSIYGYETDYKKTPFGLLNNQLKSNGIINSAGWFNIKGERLGCGDLSLKDMEKIAKNISSNEAFIVLTEANSGWSLPSHLDRSAPGIDYVIKTASWIIGRDPVKGGTIVRVRDDFDKIEEIEKDGVKYFRYPRKEAVKIIGIPVADKPKKKFTELEEKDLKKALDALINSGMINSSGKMNVKSISSGFYSTTANPIAAAPKTTTAVVPKVKSTILKVKKP